MGAVVVVVRQPVIQIDLQLLDGLVNLASERDLVELLQDGLVEALADAVGLRVAYLGLGMLDVIQGQIELVVMRFRLAAILGATIGQDADHAHALFGEERQHPVVEQIGSRDRRLGGVELGRSPLGVGIDEGLLVNPADALERADVEGVLAAEIAGMGRLDLAVGDIVFLLPFQCLHLRFGQHFAGFGDMASPMPTGAS